MNNLIRGSWKTTVMGICAIMVAIGGAGIALLDGNPETVINIERTLAEIAVGAGLIGARDNSVSSEEAGAR